MSLGQVYWLWKKQRGRENLEDLRGRHAAKTKWKPGIVATVKVMVENNRYRGD